MSQTQLTRSWHLGEVPRRSRDTAFFEEEETAALQVSSPRRTPNSLLSGENRSGDRPAGVGTRPIQKVCGIGQSACRDAIAKRAFASRSWLAPVPVFNKCPATGVNRSSVHSSTRANGRRCHAGALEDTAAPDGFEALVALHRPRIFRFALHRCGTAMPPRNRNAGLLPESLQSTRAVPAAIRRFRHG